MSTTDPPTRCVLLAPSGQRSDAREQLDRRGWIAHEAIEPLPALAELCLMERTLATRRAWERDSGEQLALVIVSPDHWSQLPDLLAAARRYVPAAAVWSYGDSGLELIAGANDGPPRAYQDVSPPSITGDEIAMLLDGDLYEHEP